MSDENCAGGCCPTDPKVIEQNFATAIRGRADSYVMSGKADEAEKLIAAARTILVTGGGGMENEAGAWVLNTQALIAASRNEFDDAVSLIRLAHATAVGALGETHPAAIVLLGNVGETLLDAANAITFPGLWMEREREKTELTQEAEKTLSQVCAALGTMQPQGLYSAEFLGAAHNSFKERLHEAQQRLPHSQAL